MDLRGTVALAAALAAGSLGLPGCGGNGEKEALRAYESTVERHMAQDATVGAHVEELRKDMDARNVESAEMIPYARETAIPFYRRFREEIASIPRPTPELEEVHAVLLSYADHRLAFLEALDATDKAAGDDSMLQLAARRVAKQEATSELLQAYGGDIKDREVITAKGTEQVFLQQTFEPFQRGQVPPDAVVGRIRSDVLPPYARIAESTAADRAAEGRPGALARWAKAEMEYFQALADAVPRFAAALGAGRRSEEEWEISQELRAEYLDRLKSYRESLR